MSLNLRGALPANLFQYTPLKVITRPIPGSLIRPFHMQPGKVPRALRWYDLSSAADRRALPSFKAEDVRPALDSGGFIAFVEDHVGHLSISPADFPRGWINGRHPEDHKILPHPIVPEFYINPRRFHVRLWYRVSFRLSDSEFVAMSFLVDTGAPTYPFELLDSKGRIGLDYTLKLSNGLFIEVTDTPPNHQPINIIGLELIQKMELSVTLGAWRWMKGLQYCNIRAQSARLPPATPFIVDAVDPGFCYSELRRSLRAIVDSIMERLLARTAEEGSRHLIWAALAHQNDPDKLRGEYVAGARIQEVSDFMLSTQGANLQDRIWDEMVEILAKVDPRVITAVDQYLSPTA